MITFRKLIATGLLILTSASIAATRPFDLGLKATPDQLKMKTISTQKRVSPQTPGSTLLWGNVSYMAEWPQNDKSQRGIYSFMASAPVGFPLTTDASMQFCYGSAVIDGKFYGMTMDAERNATLYSYNTIDWSIDEQLKVTDLSLVALATTQDYTSGTVYGEFYNKDFNGYELGIIDYTSMTRSSIGALSNVYVALGFHDGILYGIATDGYLYAINASTGFENRRGFTGIEIANTQGNYYMQGGEISPADNTFYWASIDKDGYTGMYTVDLSSGEATLCGSYVGIIYAITSPVEAEIAADAPAAIEDCIVEMSGLHTVDIFFTLPVLTSAGQTLSGKISYAIQCNGADVMTGEGMAGENISTSLELKTDGTSIITIYARNDKGRGPGENTTVWAGYDYPLAARNVVLSPSSEAGTVTLSWGKPYAGVNDGFIGELKYDIYRYINGERELVAQGITATQFSDQLPSESLSVVSYGVIADNNGMKSTETVSNVLSVGEALIPDFLEDFRTAENFRLWTQYDANGDNKTWEYDQAHHYAYYQSAEKDADDWLISPAIRMDSRRTYKVMVRANNTSNMPERLEVKMGKTPTVKGMNRTVIEPFNLMQLNQAENKFESHTNENVTVATSGDYYLGLHAISDAWMNKLRVDSIYIEAGPLSTAPNAVNNLKLQADKSGRHVVTISFTAPSTNIDNTSISGSIQKIVIKRGGVIVKTFDNVAPGQELEYTDEEANAGYNEYRVTPWADDEYGAYSSSTVWVGYDSPSPIEAIKASAEGDKVKLSWEKARPVGTHGGVVNSEEVSYIVYDASLVYGFAVAEDKIGSTPNNEFLINFDAINCAQSLKYWMVAPVNSFGEAEKTLATLLVGEAYQLPFDEHFSNGTYEKFWHLLDKKNVNVAAYPASDSSDDDGYCLQMDNYATNDEQQDIISGKINISNATNPTLLFDIKGNNRVNLASAYTLNSAGEKIELGSIMLGEEWKKCQFPLANIEKGDYVNIAFHIEFEAMDDNTWEYGSAWIDNIKVIDLYRHNLSIELSSPSSVFAGLADEPAKILVTVKNTGELTAENFSVELLEGGNEIWKEKVESLAALDDTSFQILYAPSSEYESQDIELTATLQYEEDEFIADNMASHTIVVVESEAKTPENVTISDKTGLLSWTVPDTTPDVIEEDFESYTPWMIDNIGDWMMVDADEGTVQGLFSGMINPVEGTQYAFTVFAPRDYTGDNSGIDMTATYPNLAPHSGEHYLAASRVVSGWNAVQQDNWIISPLLPCVENEISFWVNNNVVDGYPYTETFSVWGSRTIKEISEFVPLTGDILASSGEWTEIKVLIPADIKYFAIRQTSGAWDSYFFMIDDITYKRGGGDIKHYNIFIDGTKVAEIDSEETSFQIPDTGNSHEVAISALYTNGLESRPVKVAYSPEGSNVESIFDSNGQPIDIYSVDGNIVARQATSTENLAPGIYIANGKKIIVR